MCIRDRDCRETTKVEVKALFGVLYLIGIKKGSHTNCAEPVSYTHLDVYKRQIYIYIYVGVTILCVGYRVLGGL